MNESNHDGMIKDFELEKVMSKIYYDNTYDDWVKNFALNLNNIWDEKSAKELITSRNEEKSAIVIGRGPSINKKNHLSILAESDYKGTIICCDSSLISALKNGITPEKFPKFFVMTIDPYIEIKKYYDDEIVKKFGNRIKGVFSTVVKPSTVEIARKAGIKIHWIHPLFDYQEGRKSFNQISALMVRAGKNNEGLPAIQTGGNVGTAAWFMGWKILNCDTVTLIGIDHGWSDEDDWGKISSHNGLYDPIPVTQESSMGVKLFPRIFNPEFNNYCILDPIFQYYSSAFREFISRSHEKVNTINATEGGSIFGENIKCMTLKRFLEKYKK
jgi:hypothetical protein